MPLMPLPAKISKVENSQKRRVAIVGYTGVSVDLRDYGFPDPVIYNLKNGTTRDHISYYLEHGDLLGHTVENKLTDENVTHVAEHAVESELSLRVYNEINNGETYEASIDVDFKPRDVSYVQSGTVQVNNRVFDAPVFIVNNPEITGISATKGGRDPNTSVHKLSETYSEAKDLLMRVKNSSTATLDKGLPEYFLTYVENSIATGLFKEAAAEKWDEDEFKKRLENATTKKGDKDDGKPTPDTVVKDNKKAELDAASKKKKEDDAAKKKLENSSPEKKDFSYFWNHINEDGVIDPIAGGLIKNAKKEDWDEEKFEAEYRVAKIENSYPQVPDVFIPNKDAGENGFLARLANSIGVSHKKIKEEIGEKAADYGCGEQLMSLNEGLMHVANANGGRFNGHSDKENLAEHVKKLSIRNAFSTLDYPNLMHRVAAWSMDEAWELDKPQAPEFCARVDMPNHNKTGRIKPRGGNMWNAPGPKGKLDHFTAGKEDTYEVELSEVGQVVTFDRPTILADDIGIIRETLMLMVEGAIMLPDYKLCRLIQQANAAGVLIAAGTGKSYFTTTALTEANLKIVYDSIRRRYVDKEAVKDDKVVNNRLNTRFLLVTSPDLEDAAWEILNQPTRIGATDRGEKNIWFNRMNAKVFDNMDNTTYHSAALGTDWAVMAERELYRAFYISYLNGRTQPTTQQVPLPYDMLGFGVQGYWDVELGYRPVEKSKLQGYAFCKA